MLECVILFRNPTTEKVGFIHDGNGEIKVFDNRDDAIASVDAIPILQVALYQIVELDEL
jgi:hypothetical protein